MSHNGASIKLALIVGLFLMGSSVSGCTLFAGAAAGAGGYEAHQASEMDEIEDDYKAGRISKQEYEARKNQIDESSIIQ